MKIIKQDVFDGEWDILVHVCNLYHKWGAGIVIPIGKLYPEAYRADLETSYGDETKLGSFSYASIGEGKKIVNLYAQISIGNNGDPLNRNLRYDALYDALYRLCKLVSKPTIIGVPDMIGCGLAGGRREIVLAILGDLEHYFHNVNFHIFQKP